jgi:hypothetical protein|tara:strand:- start:239 stop:448 length:210 start_codon:yes stop_codon:yes gene_type:complete
MLNKGETMQKANRYQVDTILYQNGTEENITFEVKEKDEYWAWQAADAHMYLNYGQELYDADTTITKVGA